MLVAVCCLEFADNYRASVASRSLVRLGVLKMSFRKNAMKYGSFGVALVSGAANAAVDPAVTTAISTGMADGATIGGAILALVITIAIFRHIRGAK